MSLLHFPDQNEYPPAQKTSCNIGDKIVNGTLPACNQRRSLQPFRHPAEKDTGIQVDEHCEPVRPGSAPLFHGTLQKQEYQNRIKKKVYQFIRPEKIKESRNLRDQGSRYAGQYEDNYNPKESPEVIMEKILQ
jgi:hypothetical protein